MRFWKPEDIFDVKCPFCGEEIEFWKDEPARLCRKCRNEVRNPRINLGCAKWCKSAKECLGEIPEEHIAAAPIIETLRAKLKQELGGQPALLERSEDIHAIADTLLAAQGGDPCVIKSGALLAVVERADLRRQLIAEIGIEDERATLLENCLTALAAGTRTAAPEFAVISDAVKIADGDVTVDELLTEGGQYLARRRWSSEEQVAGGE